MYLSGLPVDVPNEARREENQVSAMGERVDGGVWTFERSTCRRPQIVMKCYSCIYRECLNSFPWSRLRSSITKLTSGNRMDVVMLCLVSVPRVAVAPEVKVNAAHHLKGSNHEYGIF